MKKFLFSAIAMVTIFASCGTDSTPSDPQKSQFLRRRVKPVIYDFDDMQYYTVHNVPISAALVDTIFRKGDVVNINGKDVMIVD